MAIKFGTSGWRAIIAEEFTFANVRRVVEAIARYLHPQRSLSGERKPPLPILIGYDTRFLFSSFAQEAARIFLAHDFKVHLCAAPTPTPMLAYEMVRDRHHPFAGAVNFTASHNPPGYNGIKFSSPDGAPALPEVTRAIESLVEGIHESEVRRADRLDHPQLHWGRPENAFVNRLARLVDFDAIRRSKLRLCYDAQHGTGTAVFERIAQKLRIPITMLHTTPDPSFGGHAPDPVEKHLQELKRLMRQEHAHLGLSTDGDADRFGVLDRDGSFVTPNELIALAFDYLVRYREMRGGVGRSVATTHLIDAVAAHHRREVFETPVGFKYIGELIKQDKIVIGGEESAGLTVRGHVPEKDGILACLLAAEMVAVTRKTLRQQLRELTRVVGGFYNLRLDIPIDPRRREGVEKKIENLSILLNNQRRFPKVERESRLDGKKVVFEDGSWVLVRLSGTEPVARCYCEARSPSKLRKLRQNMLQIITT